MKKIILIASLFCMLTSCVHFQDMDYCKYNPEFKKLHKQIVKAEVNDNEDVKIALGKTGELQKYLEAKEICLYQANQKNSKFSLILLIPIVLAPFFR